MTIWFYASDILLAVLILHKCRFPNRQSCAFGMFFLQCMASVINVLQGFSEIFFVRVIVLV